MALSRDVRWCNACQSTKGVNNSPPPESFVHPVGLEGTVAARCPSCGSSDLAEWWPRNTEIWGKGLAVAEEIPPLSPNGLYSTSPAAAETPAPLSAASPLAAGYLGSKPQEVVDRLNQTGSSVVVERLSQKRAEIAAQIAELQKQIQQIDVVIKLFAE